MHDNNNDDYDYHYLLEKMQQSNVGLKMILAECARKYEDAKVGQRKKASYLKMAKDCTKIIEDADNFLRQHK